MRVRVQFDPNCRFDIGERTPERRSLAALYVNAFRRLVGAHAGRPPGARQVRETPLTYMWQDVNWRLGYTLKMTRKTVTVAIFHVELVSGGNRA